MFKFDCINYNINRLTSEEALVSLEELNPQIQRLLENFEIEVFEELLKKSDFKYIQSAIGGANRFNDCKQNAHLIEEEVFLVSNHPNYIGTDLITKYLDAFKRKETYCIFFSGSWQSAWLNSKVSRAHLINSLEKLLSVTNSNDNFNFYTIELYASSIFDIKQINIGSKTARWKAIKRI